MLKSLQIFQFLFFVLCLCPQGVFADVSVNALFSDHMVIQRDTKIPVWGWADPHEKVEVTGSWGNSVKTKTGTDGAWRVDLQTPKAGGPYTITISGNNKLVINDVLSGEVWLCTGQSNMDFNLGKFLNDAREPQYQPLVKQIREEVARANDDYLRHIEVLQNTSPLAKQTHFKGQWVSAIKDSVNKITATGYFFAKALREKLNVPIGLVECSWGGTRIQPWLSEDMYMGDEHMKAYYESTLKKAKYTMEHVAEADFEDTTFQKKFDAWKAEGKKTRRPYPKVHPTKDIQLPATLYNGMLSAIIPYKIKGAIWYQGESNSHFLEDEYAAYFKTMITGWRTDWNQGDFPFYWVQLANYKVPDERSNLGWATVNNELRKSLSLPNTGMAVLYDVGEAKDVHPHNKMDAGKRLSLLALNRTYNMDVGVDSGPLYESMKVNSGKIELTFSEVASGLMIGSKYLNNPTEQSTDTLNTFQILGADNIWKPAEAKIIAKNKIEVWNTTVKQPIHVRYAWSSNPTGANLYNKVGLPAAVFSTED